MPSCPRPPASSSTTWTAVRPDGVSVEVTGEWPVWSDFNTTNEEALHKAELFSAIPTIILLLIAFGSAIAAGLPLMLALAGIAVGFASLHLIGNGDALSVWSMNFSMMIGLAVGIDYSLFIVSRYREEREDGYRRDRRDRQHARRRRARLCSCPPWPSCCHLPPCSSCP